MKKSINTSRGTFQNDKYIARHDNCAENFADKEKKMVKTCLDPCLNLQNFLQIHVKAR